MAKKNNKKINIVYQGLGACQRVTGSSNLYTIKVNDKETKILVDLGAIQDGKYSARELFKMNKLDIDMEDVDHVIVTHAHLDHTMNLCQLPRVNFNGNIYCTSLTQELMEHITMDGINIHDKTVEFLNKGAKKYKEILPYMNMRSRDQMISMVRGYGYEKWIVIDENIKFKFIPTGHISGASSIVLEVKDGYERECIFISGDTSATREIPFTKMLDLADKKYSFTAMQLESTYADNYVKPKSEASITGELYNLVKTTCEDKKGIALIPAFSLARSTNLLLFLKKMYENYPDLKKFPIYGISPLMVKCHNSISLNSEFYDDRWKGEMDLFTWKQLTMVSEYEDMKAIINRGEPCIIVASSGMGNKGMNSYLLPKIIENKKNSVSFTGYLAYGTEGYKLINKQQKTITSMIDGQKYTAVVKSRLQNISGLSSHASGQEIIRELLKTEKKKVKNIILVHGDKERCEGFKRLLEKEYDKNVNIHIPKIGEKIKLA